MASPAPVEDWDDDSREVGARADVGRSRAVPGSGAWAAADSSEDRLLRLAASVGPLRRVLTRIAARLVAGRSHERLGYARLSDYARERVGLSARQLHELARVDRRMAGLPALERALVANLLPWSKVRLLARVATPGDVGAWIARATATPSRRLEQEVRERGREPDPGRPLDPDRDLPDPIDTAPVALLRLRCTPAVREKWSVVREVSQRVAGERLRADETLEWVLAEVASAMPADPERFAGWDRAVGAGVDPSADPPHAGKGPARRADARTLPPEVLSLATGVEDADAFELDRRLRAAVRLEQTLDAAMAPLLRWVTSPEYEWRDDWSRLSTLAREHLGISPSKARSLVRLERAGDACQALRTAYRSGRISWVKARILIPLLRLDVDGDGWRDAWVAWAQRVTVRRLEQDVERALLLRAGYHFAWQRCKRDPARAQDPIPESERQMCAHEIDVDATEELLFRVPLPVAALFRALRVGAGIAFEAMLDHALATWLRTDPGKRPDPVIVRDGWRCAVPGCMSRRNLQDHHIEFRSHGGSEDPGNRITLCAFHHHRGVHAGLVRIRGIAPDGLVFELGVRPGVPPLARYRSGDIEVL
jgi:hypothetical protein